MKKTWYEKVAEVMVVCSDTMTNSLRLATYLRSKGIRTSLYPEPAKFARQLKYADSLGVDYVTWPDGEDYILKNMETGEQQRREYGP